MATKLSLGQGFWGVFLLGIALGSTIFGSQPAWSPGVTLGWTASLDSTVTGYYVHIGTNSGVYTDKIDVGPNLTFSTNGLAPGMSYYFSVTSYNAARTESVFTPEATFIPPGMLTLVPGDANSDIRIQFPVSPAHYYELQSSLDLKVWSDAWVTPYQTSNTWVEYDQPSTNTIPGQFYRLILH